MISLLSSLDLSQTTLLGADFHVGRFILQVLLFVTSLWLIFLVLIQRGKGGGLTGALGGSGGSSAFGAKAGDTFTKVTVVSATIWIFLCMLTIATINRPPAPTPVVENNGAMMSGESTMEDADASGDADAAGDADSETTEPAADETDEAAPATKTDEDKPAANDENAFDPAASGDEAGDTAGDSAESKKPEDE